MSDASPEPGLQPRRSRPSIPGYGLPTDEEGMLSWDWAIEQIAQSQLYWMSTTRPDGRPHAKPVWGVVMDGTIYLETGPDSRGGRNLAANPAIVVHFENGDAAFIVEGTAEKAFALPRKDAERMAQVYGAKYGAKGYQPTPEQYMAPESGLYRIRPRVAFGFVNFVTDATRWTF
jgi:nitroimidazol reductase NimA-like FMN-containing flavoprotein (pyridoxamine 5'-phosphate oxidase superfamily)